MWIVDKQQKESVTVIYIDIVHRTQIVRIHRDVRLVCFTDGIIVSFSIYNMRHARIRNK
jgi:hypothetical protein